MLTTPDQQNRSNSRRGYAHSIVVLNGRFDLELQRETSVKRTEPPNQEEFDGLLAWLDADRDRAGIILYQEICPKLIKVLERRQCDESEALAHEAINRVSHQVKDIAGTYQGDPALYFYGVLRNVHLEWLDEEKKKRKFLDEEKRIKNKLDCGQLHLSDASAEEERMHRYLEKCRQKLEPPADRALILQYYEKERRSKIDHRKRLADELGITLNNLRMRIHRINLTLRKCIVDCIGASESAESGDVLAG